MNSLSDWLCNVLLWGAIVGTLGLIYETYVSQGLLASGLPNVIGLVVVAVLSLFWPRY
jgi:hypothetical protein